jgi:hypothetical protein
MHLIIHEDYEKRKIFTQFVQYSFMDKQNEHRLTTCEEDFIQPVTPIYTGDKPWEFQYDPETKHQSIEW